MKTAYFADADEMIDTLKQYNKVYNRHLIQRNLGYITPVKALKEWQKKKPKLFNKESMNRRILTVYWWVGIANADGARGRLSIG